MRKKALAALPLLKTKRKGITLCPQVDGDTLVLDVWAKPTEYRGRYCIRANGEYMALIGGVWQQRKLTDLCFARKYYRWNFDRAGAKCDSAAAEKVCTDFLDMAHGESIEGAIDCAETRFVADKRHAAIERKYKKINEDIMAEVPPLPDGLDDWTRRVVFGGEQHLYPAEGAGKDAYACTACGRVHRIKDAKHGRTYRCERTGADVRLDKVHGDKTRHAYAMVLQRLDGGRCIARHLKLVSHWHGNAQDIFTFERCRLFLGESGLIGMYHGQRKDADEFEQEWYDRNPYSQNPMCGFCYPEGAAQALADTPYCRLGIAEMAEKGWKMDYNSIMFYHKDQLSKAQSASGDAKASEKELRDKLKKQFETKLAKETDAVKKEAADAKKALEEAESMAAADKSAALSAQREELSSAYAEQLSLLTEERDRAVAASQNAGNESIARFSVIFENIQTELSQLRELAEQVEKDGDTNKSSWLIGCVKRLFAQIAEEW